MGPDNFFLFGLTAEQVHERKSRGYRPFEYYESNSQLRDVLDLISSGFFTPDRPDLFRPLVDSILYWDEYMLAADYHSYVDAQERVSRTFLNREQWTRMSILNVARIGKFSSDRAIREYCEKVWDIKAVNIKAD